MTFQFQKVIKDLYDLSRGFCAFFNETNVTFFERKYTVLLQQVNPNFFVEKEINDSISVWNSFTQCAVNLSYSVISELFINKLKNDCKYSSLLFICDTWDTTHNSTHFPWHKMSKSKRYLSSLHDLTRMLNFVMRSTWT